MEHEDGECDVGNVRNDVFASVEERERKARKEVLEHVRIVASVIRKTVKWNGMYGELGRIVGGKCAERTHGRCDEVGVDLQRNAAVDDTSNVLSMLHSNPRGDDAPEAVRKNDGPKRCLVACFQFLLSEADEQPCVVHKSLEVRSMAPRAAAPPMSLVVVRTHGIPQAGQLLSQPRVPNAARVLAVAVEKIDHCLGGTLRQPHPRVQPEALVVLHIGILVLRGLHYGVLGMAVLEHIVERHPHPH
mmetsp:Transcript_2262/g.8064  ORF Transcript_2262/g.8064 Transcript_2262/m.8064 type:complete len:245 (-) Transcript_2262:42-776(-)